ncbi:TlpA family protein disulfide reductase [Flavihumibacter rivuli]|uniref:TlpA family protein disulfide reductase n=1 Tax=Flavihumibacter rivuli TaxID=2838156 RepID=UPI001BDF4502|nr:TlpA disulfide reductase family protein [Flavihumibacter rivuli]ULQ55923.1 TlpA family protein disulfide reductase [Flavihumibacter rivuli]
MGKILMLCLGISLLAIDTLLAQENQVESKSTVDVNRGFIVNVGEKAPGGILLELTNGEKLTLESLRGKVVLLQFTASWCVVCRKEMPHLEKEVWQVYKDRGLVLIGIDRDEPIDTVRQFASKMKVTYPLALDPGAAIFHKFASRDAGVTRNVLIDRNGNISFLTRLFDMQEFEQLKQKISELLN